MHIERNRLRRLQIAKDIDECIADIERSVLMVFHAPLQHGRNGLGGAIDQNVKRSMVDRDFPESDRAKKFGWVGRSDRHVSR